jgi:hypothetical protein
VKRTVICSALLIIALCLVASAAMADQCKPINARLPAGEYLGDCTYNNMDFAFCIDTPVTGTLKGTWHYYGPEGNAVNWPDDASDPFPYSSFTAGWALDVFETNKGMIYAQDNYLFNGSVVGNRAGFPFVSLSSITGGTGHWEGAWGWFGVIADDAGGWKGFMKGEICTP